MSTKTRLISDKELYDSIVGLIKKAKSDIKISSPWIYNCDHILDEIVAANSRGAKISVVMRQPQKDLSDKNYQDKLNTIEKLREAKADIIFDPYVHEKVIISDGMDMIVSSANLIGTSLTRNGESGTYTNDFQEIEKYQLRFARKYGKKPIKPQKVIVGKQVIIATVVIVVIIFATFILSQLDTEPRDIESGFTVSSLLNEKPLPLNEIVIVSGLVADTPEDYTAKTSGNLYKQFYISDKSKQIKVFCSKDVELKISKNEKIEVTGKFTMFSNEYQITDLLCSKIEKK